MTINPPDENVDEEETGSAGPPGLTPHNRAELESMLDAGMNSGPPIRLTSEFWEERKRVQEERAAKRRGESA
jgi:hypothetical protein